MIKLTPQREKFAQGLVKGLSQAEAYRQAYPKSKMWTDSALHREASVTANDPKVSLRIVELRKEVIKSITYTVEDAMREAEEARQLALRTDTPAAAVSATTLKSKLNGLLVEDRANNRQPLQDAGDAELDRMLAAAAKEAGVKLTQH